jgi:hypothetical protein
MNRQLLKVVLLSAVLLSSLNSCKKDDGNISNSNLKEFSEDKRNETRDKFAKVLAIASESKAVRDFIKNEALKKFNGDFEILYEAVKNKKVTESQSFLQILEATAKSINNGGNNDIEFLTTIAQVEPTLTIYLSSSTSSNQVNWQTSKVINVVVAKTTDSEASTILKTYDSKGNVGQINAKSIPQNPTLVVRDNERVLAYSRLDFEKGLVPVCTQQLKPFFENGSYNYYFTQIVRECTTPTTGRSPIQPTPTYGGGGVPDCDRDRKSTKDLLHRFTFTSVDAMDELESWWKGDPEMYFIAQWISATGPNVLNTVRKYCKQWDSDEYFIGNNPRFRESSESGFPLEIITWTRPDFADKMKYSWFEEDTGSKLTIELKLAAKIPKVFGIEPTVEAKVGFEIIDSDDNAGESIVEFCDAADGEGFIYNTGRILMGVKHKD